ncbi:DeoR/GlpR family DNA-binding transcription regulator [Pararhizobium mangrovi]|uniref:DeoR C-terminal sensor domain-containing protein n=1 Tax=Pararhizobium mangrovi TaxID=2590452 RepID=A0A506U513_9HYPH|nr:hypothetical protein [Pararhizobium mangrovi]TPW28164.1 hypothetical protein FJU11_09895 [Pararhizobium mangrovi]
MINASIRAHASDGLRYPGTCLLADSSRFGARAIYRIGALERVRQIITDEGLPADECERIRAMGIALTPARTDLSKRPALSER